ncbi:hypothetical protein Hypma_010450 [Hypsizygus marmoreus]|uniref:Uncharacterized protein n=1 Tax=Hypsizygus marmoreus TaxID=39966 RepID=A0A369KH24_HYPMA|nr:hypothetical protein Hypma_010450 [Hypsizygus marmoreus]
MFARSYILTAILALSSSSAFAHPVHSNERPTAPPHPRVQPNCDTDYNYRVKASDCTKHAGVGFTLHFKAVGLRNPCYDPRDVPKPDEAIGYCSTLEYVKELSDAQTRYGPPPPLLPTRPYEGKRVHGSFDPPKK